MKLKISAIVITYNEELNIGRCLNSLDGWLDEIIILDSNSTDNTQKIVQNYTDKFYKHTFESHALQWKWGLENLPIKNDWILGLDSDQWVSAELKEKLIDLFENNNPTNADGYYIKRKQIFLGQWIKYGGYYPKYLLKLFKKDKVIIDENELVDHHFYINGNTEIIDADIVEDNIKERDLSFWFSKHIKYADLFAKELVDKKKSMSTGKLSGPDRQTQRIKHFYNKLPIFIRPILYFIWRYFFQLGFLDGKKGFIFHFFHALCFRFIVDAEIYELKKSKK